MKKYIKELKKYKYTTIASLAFLVLVIFLIIVYNIAMPSNSLKYGNRLEGIDEVEVTNKQLKKLNADLSNDEKVKKVESNISGRIIKVFITVKEDTSKDKAKEIASSVTKSFEKNQVAYYDFEVFVSCEKEKDEYPFIGYKNNDSEGFTY